MNLLIDNETTPQQMYHVGKMLLAMAAADGVTDETMKPTEPIKLIDDVPPAPLDVRDFGAIGDNDPLAVMQAAQVDPLFQAQLKGIAEKFGEPPAPPKPVRAPRKPKATAEPPAPIPAIPVPPPVQLSIPMPPQTAPTVPAAPVVPTATAQGASVPQPPVLTASVVTATPPVPAIPLPPPAATTAAAVTTTPQVNGAAPSNPPATFPELMQWAMPHIAAKRMDNTTLTAACNAAGLPSLQSLIARQDLVGAVHANLLAAIGGGAA